MEECAQDYQTKLQELLTEQDQVIHRIVRLDNPNSFLSSHLIVILLGMGPDGHTASLFPNHSVLNVNKGLVTSVKDSPKPPPERVTLTLNTINQSKHKITVVTGESKSTIVKEVIEDKSIKYPIGQVKDLIWYLDKAAASKLSRS